jgi:cyclopropane fatty-acyl-phospholipid synthase-like methyltransferase
MIISIDAFHYFGCEQNFLTEKLVPYLKSGGIINVAVPGMKTGWDNKIPEPLQPYIKLEYNFRSCNWWKNLWSKEKGIKITDCYEMKCFEKAWNEWLECDNEFAKSDVDMIKADNGKYMNLVNITAVKS